VTLAVTDSAPPVDVVREFVATMPREYRYVFSERGMKDHATLALGRRGAVVRVGRFHSSRDLGAAPVCVVADDRPGLLATISAALVMEALDVVHAEAYTRRRTPTAFEAVDVFWVRDREHPNDEVLEEGRLRSLEKTLARLLLGDLTIEEAQAAAGTVATTAGYEANVRFIEGDDGTLSTLEVETADRAGLLLALAQALFTQRVQIIRSEVHTYHEKVQDRFVIQELDGSPIGPARRLDIQVAVLAALEPRALS
jgi:[protein-PII] uridylyltransferase